MSEARVVYVLEDKAYITCTECGKSKQIPVGKFKGARQTIKIRCSCKNEFLINLNFRKEIRKKVDIEGKYRKASLHHSNMEECCVVDLSFRGVRLKIQDTQHLKVDDELILHFILDDTRKTEVERKIRICNITGEGYVGAQFLDPEMDNFDKHIGFYLMG
ncbi:MAG: PilZ domain-containing protein [Desulfobulbaceae bacterium]|nr:PilZ domain-containing protein [Desulfobulbaceae bacterium]